MTQPLSDVSMLFRRRAGETAKSSEYGDDIEFSLDLDHGDLLYGGRDRDQCYAVELDPKALTKSAIPIGKKGHRLRIPWDITWEIQDPVEFYQYEQDIDIVELSLSRHRETIVAVSGGRTLPEESEVWWDCRRQAYYVWDTGDKIGCILDENTPNSFFVWDEQPPRA